MRCETCGLEIVHGARPHHTVWDCLQALKREVATLRAAGHNLAARVMGDHRAQLPSEAMDLYGGGCGCPQCRLAGQLVELAPSHRRVRES